MKERVYAVEKLIEHCKKLSEEVDMCLLLLCVCCVFVRTCVCVCVCVVRDKQTGGTQRRCRHTQVTAYSTGCIIIPLHSHLVERKNSRHLDYNFRL